jgi:hypothetical protein
MRRLSILLALFLLAACAPEPTPLATATRLPSATVSPMDTATPLPSPTYTVTAAPTVTSTSTATVTASPSATPQVALDQAEVIRINEGVGGVNLVLAIPNLNTAYNLILGGVRYDCELNDQYPDWLFCWGLSRPTLDIPLTEAFLDQQTNQVVLQQKVVLSSAMLPTALPAGYGDTDCPLRGQNISCETECRLDYDGNPCIVATCTDACGLYRSVHSCPQDMPLPSRNCDPEQWAAAKAKYGIP